MSLSDYKVGQYGGYFDHSDLVSANIGIWSSQSGNYNFYCTERHGHSNPSRFAFDSDGQVWFHNDGLWSQWTTVVVHKVSNISFVGTGESRTYHDHSSTYHTVNTGANHQRESSWGT